MELASLCQSSLLPYSIKQHVAFSHFKIVFEKSSICFIINSKIFV